MASSPGPLDNPKKKKKSAFFAYFPGFFQNLGVTISSFQLPNLGFAGVIETADDAHSHYEIKSISIYRVGQCWIGPGKDLVAPRVDQSQSLPLIGCGVLGVEALQDEGVEGKEAAARLALGEEVVHGELRHLKRRQHGTPADGLLLSWGTHRVDTSIE